LKPLIASTACLDWERRIVAGESLVPPPLFPAEAEDALAMMRSLRIVDAPGEPTFGEVARSWVFDFAASVFGAYDATTGRRMIREFLLLISKKNGKSTVAAAIMVTALLRNWRRSGEFYILAPTIEVANNSFFPARDMIKADPELDDLLHLKETERTIIHRGTGALLKVVAADAETVSGKKAIGVLFDELWLFGKRANADNMIREAMGGLVSRPEGFVIYLTTQSDEPPAGVFKSKLQYFRDVRDGKIVDPKSLGMLFEFPPAMVKSQAYLEPENFGVTNPNLGLSVDPEWIAEELVKATHAGDQARNVFLAKHLNVEIGMNLRADRWAGADFWPQCADPTLTLESLLRRAECVTIGIDGGGLDDLLGLAVVGREAQTKRWLVWGRAYCRISVFRRRKAIAAELLDFVKDGDLWVYDGEGRMAPEEILVAMDEKAAPAPPPAPREEGAPVELAPDIAALVEVVGEVLASGKLAIVGIDTAGVGLIVEGLKTIGVQEEEAPGAPLTGVRQGYMLMGPIKTSERMLADQTLVHAGQPLMSWAVGNARTEAKGNAVMITKALAGVTKIDPLMAMFNGVALMSTNPEPAGGGPSVYEDRGFLVI
jgi:phage terminase large subunit-like protein